MCGCAQFMLTFPLLESVQVVRFNLLPNFNSSASSLCFTICNKFGHVVSGNLFILVAYYHVSGAYFCGKKTQQVTQDFVYRALLVVKDMGYDCTVEVVKIAGPRY